MKKNVLANRKAWSAGIAVYELLGGIISLVFIFLLIRDRLSIGVIIILIPILIICVASIFAGIAHFSKKDERFYFLSKLSFCGQLLQLVVPGFAYIFYYGPYLAIGMDGDFSFLGKFEMLTMNFAIRLGESDQYYVMLNLVPVLPLLALRWLERDTSETDQKLETAFMDEV